MSRALDPSDGSQVAAALLVALDEAGAGTELATTRLRSVVRGLGSLQADLHAIDPGEVPLLRLDGRGYLEHDLARRRAAIAAEDPTGTWEWRVVP